MVGLGLRVSRAVGFAFVALVVAAPAIQAGVNTWTGGRLEGDFQDPVTVVSDPHDPYVVYSVVQPHLYKSLDGGRGWTRIATFQHIDALMVHPAAPATLYAGVVEGEDFIDYWGIVKSTDGGATWVRKPLPSNAFTGTVAAIAGNPTEANTVFFGAGIGVYKSINGGDSWTFTTVSGIVASLVVSPRETETVYAGSYDYSYFFSYPAAFSRSSDGGATWTEADLGNPDNVKAIAADPSDESRVFVGLSALEADGQTGIRRSDDGGETFHRSDTGLPTGSNVSSLVIDPANPSTLYAATESGVFRSRDSGSSWSAFGQALSGRYVDSLAISADGRYLHAASGWGTFDLEVASGPVDIAATPGGGAHVLRWNSDRLAVQTVDGSNHWTGTPFSASTEWWSGIAIASAGDGAARTLWLNGDGRSAVEKVGPTGGSTVTLDSQVDDLPIDVAVGPDGRPRLLLRSIFGAMRIAVLGDDGHLTGGPRYGPAPGWTVIAIDADAEGRTWVLWRSADGRGAASIHVDGVLVDTVKWGATAGWWVEDLGVGSDGRARILARNVAGAMQVWTVGEDGSRSVGATHESPGLVPRRIAAGADGLTRVLWGGDHGEGSVWFLTSSGNHVAVDVPVLP